MTQQVAAPVTGVSGADVAGTVDGVTSVGAAGPDLSLISLLLHAEPLVLIIMLALIAMSVACWAVIIEKFTSLRSALDKTAQFENEFWSSDSLDRFYEKLKKRKARHPMAVIFSSAMDEWLRTKQPERVVKSERTNTGELTISTKERIAQMMTVSINRELERLERGLGFLATCGSSAPFIGLLGTCIGIINAFTAIAGSQNTSLAVVAPGIAEALFATAIGLAVAIPAVIAYNRFNGEVNRLAGKFDDFATEFQALLSRQTDSSRSNDY